MGSVASSWTVYAQPNETNSQSDNVIQVIPETSSEKNNENTGEQLTTESDSPGNESGSDDNQILTGKSNTSTRTSNSQPDGDCLFDPSLPKCAPDENGNCPEGFHMNENEQCFPAHDGGCPDGYHSPDDDETGRCIPNSEGCPSGMIFRPDMKTCGYKDDVCRTYPNLDDCKTEEPSNGSNTLAYKSGYNYGCSDSKISDSSKKYINQPGKGPSFHTSQFMSGYTEGFEICSNGNNPASSNSKGTFKVIVQVTNQLPRDTSGGITVSVGNYPDNIFKAASNIYFPAGQTVSKVFTFKSSDVPLGAEFEANLDYGDDYNQYILGINTPAKKPEIVQFFIS